MKATKPIYADATAELKLENDRNIFLIPQR